MIGFQSLAFSWTLSSQKWSAVQSHGKQEKWGGRLLSPCCSQNEDGVQRTPLNKTEVRHSWVQLIRWSKTKQHQNGISEIDLVSKVAVFGGGSFGTAMGVALARKKESLKVHLPKQAPSIHLPHPIHVHVHTQSTNHHSILYIKHH